MCLRLLIGRFSSVSDVYFDVITVGVVWEIAPEVRARNLVSPDVCVVGCLGHRECDVDVCALCLTGIRSIYDSDVYCGVITVGVVRKIAPEVRARKFVSPEIGVGGSLCHRELCWAVRGPQLWDTSCIVCIRGNQSSV